MPFVPSSEAQLISEKLTLSPQDVVPEEEPTMVILLAHCFAKKICWFMACMQPEGLPDTKDDPTLMLTLCLLRMSVR